MTQHQPFSDRAGDFAENLRANGGGHQIRLSDQRHRRLAAAVDGADVVDALHAFLLAHHVHRVASTAVQQIQHRLIDVGEGQLNPCVRQQLADKTAADVPCAKM